MNIFNLGPTRRKYLIFVFVFGNLTKGDFTREDLIAVRDVSPLSPHCHSGCILILLGVKWESKNKCILII